MKLTAYKLFILYDSIEHVHQKIKGCKQSKRKFNPAEEAADEDDHGISTDISDLWTQHVGEIPLDILLGKPGRPRLNSERFKNYAYMTLFKLLAMYLNIL